MLSHAQLATLTHPVTIREARPDDARRLAELAQLDSAPPLGGDVLVAEEGQRPLAALDVVSGRVVADPFRSTAGEAELLRARAAQRRPRRARRGVLGRLAGAAR